MINKLVFLSLSLVISFSVLADEDPWKAVFGFQSKLAEQGNAEAQYKMGEMCEDGRGTRKNFKKARIWYGKAANQGHYAAKYKLGTLYEKGLGGAADRQKALRLYEDAANHGNPEARARLEKWRKNNSSVKKKTEPRRVTEQSDEENLRQMKKKHAEQERARKAEQAKRRAEQEKARKAALVKKRAEQERARKAEQEKKRTEREKALKAAALAKKQAQAEASQRKEPHQPVGQSAEQDVPDETTEQAEGDTNSFESDPCKSPASRFMSTCLGK